MSMSSAAEKETKETMSIRIRRAERDMIDRAAEAKHSNRSAFMIEASLRYAEETLLDRRLFVVDEGGWEALKARLDQPPAPSEALIKTLSTPAPWK